MGEPVEFLYRYRSLRGYSRGDVERILAHSQIRFSSPAWFNDPFDCKLPPLVEGTESEKREWLNASYVPTTYPRLSEVERAQAVEKLLPNVGDLAKAHVEYTLSELIPKSGVLCLDEVEDDLLMWSHYADSHRGICLRFRRSAMKFSQVFKEKYPPPYDEGHSVHSYEYEPQPVDYTDTVPTVNLFSDPAKAWGACVFTKSLHWSYEREWRVLVPPAPSQEVIGRDWQPLLSGALAGLILGCQIIPEDEQLVREWLKIGGIQLPLCRAKKKSDRFELEIVEAE